LGTYLYAVELSGLSGTASLGLGGLHSCLTSAGQVLCFGHNQQGQLGNGSDTNSASPTPPLLSTSPELPLSGALGLTAIGSTTCARRAQDVRCWGEGWDGRLGDGTFDSVAALPRQVVGIEATSHLGGGGSTACAIVDGSIWCWGANHLGDGTTAPRATPGEVTLP
jgi:alpha-tubulin suppressor-like RCC1 family protein